MWSLTMLCVRGLCSARMSLHNVGTNRHIFKVLTVGYIVEYVISAKYLLSRHSRATLRLADLRRFIPSISLSFPNRLLSMELT